MSKHRITIAVLCLASVGAAAQVRVPDPGAINQHTRDTFDYYERVQHDDAAAREDLVADAAATPPGPAAEPADTAARQTIEVRRIVTNPSEILGEGELRAVIEPFEGRRMTMEELFEVTTQIQLLYRSHGRLAARAVIPVQEVTDGTVRVQLVESRLGKLVIKGNASTDEAYIREQITARPGDLIEVKLLETDLQRFNALHDVRLKAALAPGTQFGTTDYVVSVEEPRRNQPRAFIDNAGREDVGLYRLGFSLANASVFGRRDRLALGFHLTEDFSEGTKGGALSYEFPVGRRGTRLGLSYDVSDVVVVSGPIEVLNVRGDSSNVGLSMRHPLAVSARKRVDLFGTVAKKKSSTDFDEVELFDTDTRTLSVGADILFRNPGSTAFMRHQLTADPGLLGGDGRFLRYNGDFSLTRLHDNNVVTKFRARGQLASVDLLPSTEQFQLGGVATVRGYKEGLLIGDDGYFLSAEVSFPWAGDVNAGRTFLFFDHGATYPSKGNDEGRASSDRLTSIGVGTTFQLNRGLSGQLSLGFPLESRDSSDGDDGPTFHFMVQAAPNWSK